MAIKSTIIPTTAVSETPVRLSANAAALAGRVDRGIKFTVDGNLYWGPAGVSSSTGKQVQSGDQIDPASVESLGDIYLVSDADGATFSAEVVGQVVALA